MLEAFWDDNWSAIILLTLIILTGGITFTRPRRPGDRPEDGDEAR